MSRLSVFRNYRYRRFLRNLWEDDPDTVGTGWTDNGDGSYTCDGTNAAVVVQNVDAGVLADGGNYEIAFDIIAYTAGTFRIALFGPDDLATSSPYTAIGSYVETINIDTTTASAANRLVLQSISSFNGTAANIKIREIDRP